MKLLLCCGCILVAAMIAVSPSAHTAAAAAPTTTGASTADSLRTLNGARNAVRSYARRATQANAHSLRAELIERLDDAARVIPGDPWLAGQRVGLRVKQGWHTAAVAAALRCQAASWWCDALAGFALHVEGSLADADEAFQRALATMPTQTRCDWAAELLHVLAGRARATFAAASCDERVALEERLWWLADPLFIMAGNDRRTEHYTRLVAMQLHHELLALQRQRPCADEHHHLVLRTGWPDWWWGAGPLEGGQGGQRFLPVDRAWSEPLGSAGEDWLHTPGTAGERYRPPYGDILHLPHQAAMFVRGDSVLVLAAADLGRFATAGVVLSRSERERPVVALLDEGGRWPLRVAVEPGAWLVGIEAIRPSGGASRARFGHALPDAPPGAPRVSDLLLVDWSDRLDADLDAVAARMIPTTRIARSRPIALYWEVYGEPDDELTIGLAAEPADAGALRRLAEGMRLRTPRDGVSVRWDESAPGEGVLRGLLRLDLAGFEAGRYQLRMEVRRGDGPATAVLRPIELLAP